MFAELRLTPKENGRRQATVELDLESILPASAQPPEIAMNHGRIATLTLCLRLGDLGNKGGVRLTGLPIPSLNKNTEDVGRGVGCWH